MDVDAEEEEEDNASMEGNPEKRHCVCMMLTRRGLGLALTCRYTTTRPTKMRCSGSVHAVAMRSMWMALTGHVLRLYRNFWSANLCSGVNRACR